MNAEGWCVDPYHRHAARWSSGGTATGLVRDGEHESQDPPPAEAFDGPLENVAEVGGVNGEDLIRAGDPPAPDPAQAAMDTFGSVAPTS